MYKNILLARFILFCANVFKITETLVQILDLEKICATNCEILSKCV